MGYLGSKATAGLCQTLIAMMPSHSRYIETHLGGGAIMKRKPPALCNIGIDLDAVELVHGCCHRFLSVFPLECRVKWGAAGSRRSAEAAADLDICVRAARNGHQVLSAGLASGDIERRARSTRRDTTVLSRAG